MLDRTDFESWQQRIRLYCLGKDNGENIMKSITEGPFQMGMVTETLAEETEGALQQGPVRARVFTDLSAQEKERYKADIRATNILLQGIPKDIYTLINHYTDAKDIWDNVKMILEGSELTKDDRESQLYDEFERFHQIKRETIHVYYVRFITEVKLNRGLKESNFDQLYAYLKQHEVHANENRMMMERFIQPTNDPLALLSNASVQQYPTQSSMSPQSSNEPSPTDNFQLDSGSSSTEYLIKNGRVVVQDIRGRYNANNQGRPFQRNNARGNVVAGNAGVLDEEQLLFLTREQVTNFDDDVDDLPNKDLALNVDRIFEADQCDAFDFNVDEAPNMHTMFMVNLSSEDPIYDKVGPSYDSNTPFEYVEDNEENVVQSNVSSVQNDALRSIIDEMHEEGVQSRIVNKQDRVVKDSLNSELARYKELVGEYEKRARFELTEREQKIDEQMRIIISDRNRKETSLKLELHTVQMQLRFIRDQYKSKTKEVTILKKDFKQTEDKYLEEFLDMKRLKGKVKDRLYKQDQSIQTVHMLCRPNPFYDEKKKVVIGYKNPLCLTRAKQVQSALYNGTEIVMTNHKPVVVHDLEETLEIAELTRKRMYEKMKSPLCIQNKVKFAPPDYLKENYLAIFTPPRDLTPEQIF
ncbi:hypothetical protein Tco_1185429 [Tanacetum coccineum]